MAERLLKRYFLSERDREKYEEVLSINQPNLAKAVFELDDEELVEKVKELRIERG